MYKLNLDMFPQASFSRPAPPSPSFVASATPLTTEAVAAAAIARQLFFRRFPAAFFSSSRASLHEAFIHFQVQPPQASLPPSPPHVPITAVVAATGAATEAEAVTAAAAWHMNFAATRQLSRARGGASFRPTAVPALAARSAPRRRGEPSWGCCYCTCHHPPAQACQTAMASLPQ